MAVINGIAHSSGGFYPVEIQQSLRFDAASNSYLSRTFPVAGNRKTWTYSVWVKRSSLGGAGHNLFHANSVAESHGFLQFVGDDRLRFASNDNATTSADYRTSAVFRDTSAWCHICLSIDYTIPAVNLYVNGVLQQWGTIIATPTAADVTAINNNVVHEIGRYTTGDVQQFDGYMAESRFIDGQALDATAFGEFKNGVWVPKKYEGLYGTNGFYLDFSDGANIGADRSGNGNDYTPTNLASTDIMLDSPTNNFCTFSPLATVWGEPKPTLQEGNTKLSLSQAAREHCFSTHLIPEQGLWYSEIHIVDLLTTSDPHFGVVTEDWQEGVYNFVHLYKASGEKWIENVRTAYGEPWSNGDIIACLVDKDTNQITFFRNGTSQGALALNGSGHLFYLEATLLGATFVANWGQDSSFAGAKTRQGFTDANGIGDFYFQPPAGALALCTANFPEPAFSPLDDSLPSDHFNTIVWNGDGATTRSLTGVGFQPDWVWSKARNTAYSNTIWDAVRGGIYELSPNYDAIETANSPFGWITSFDNDGFSVTGGTSGTEHVNQNTVTYVAWNWKAGGAPVTNNAGSITSTVSANVEAGFSIVGYTGAGVIDTVGHGLAKKPEAIFYKLRTGVMEWVLLTSVIDGSSDYMWLSDARVAGDASEQLPTATVFEVAVVGAQSGQDYIAYCFHSVEGFSKIGTYTGNGIANDGTFVYTGFKPAYLMIKRADAAGNWHVFDNTRDSYNPVDQILNPNLVDAETVYPDGIDFLSNGFKHLGTGAGLNADGGAYLYMAFAEMPFKYANAR